jgi:hypothetical protein
VSGTSKVVLLVRNGDGREVTAFTVDLSAMR